MPLKFLFVQVVKSKRHGAPLVLVQLLLLGGFVGYFYALFAKFEVISEAAEKLWSTLQKASESIAGPNKPK